MMESGAEAGIGARTGVGAGAATGAEVGAEARAGTGWPVVDCWAISCSQPLENSSWVRFRIPVRIKSSWVRSRMPVRIKSSSVWVMVESSVGVKQVVVVGYAGMVVAGAGVGKGAMV